MKRSVRVAVAVVVICGAIPWQSSHNLKAAAKQPVPEPPPLQPVKSVTIDDLSNGKLTKNELVKVNYKLQSFQADIFAPSVKKIMGPFGQVIPLENTNELILIDSVENLGAIVKIINMVENEEGRQPNAWQCQHIGAAVAADKIKMLLDPPNALAGNAALAQPAGKGARQVKPHTVVYDDATNMVFVTGPRDKLTLARMIMAKIDQPGPGVARVFVLKNGEANKIADLVRDKLGNDPGVPLVKSDKIKNAIVVVGMPNQVEVVRLMIESVSGERIKGSQDK